MLQVNPRWMVLVVLLASGAILEYLVLNRLNSINVQNRELDIQPVLSATDLSVSTNDSITTDGVSTTSATFPETSPQNPIANTVLRGAILPHVAKLEPKVRQCHITGFASPRENVVQYGFPTRSWQHAMLPAAVNPQVLRVEIGKNRTIPGQQLPINATRAASLFANGMLILSDLFPWFETYWINAKEREPTLAKGENRSVGVAEARGLLPDDQASQDETSRREWFLRESRNIMATGFSSKKKSERAVAMEFAHVDISPAVTFDALTLQVELSADYMPGQFKLPNGTMYSDVSRTDQCGAIPGECVFAKPPYGRDPYSFDIPSQVNVLAACDSGDVADGGLAYRYSNLTGWKLSFEIDCDSVSSTSLFVVSVGKYLVADRLDRKVRCKPSQALSMGQQQ